MSEDVVTIYVMSMTRTTVYLSSEAKRRLASAARRRHRSEADLIRHAIDQMLAEEPEAPMPNPPELAIDPSVADHLDDYLSDGFGTDGMGSSW
jgi:Ribbon-helix-helix protein, copG family